MTRPWTVGAIMMSCRTLLLLLLLLVATTHAQECDSRTGKCDQHERCTVWAEEGECDTSTSYMMVQCPGSCGKKITDMLLNGDTDDDDEEDYEEEEEEEEEEGCHDVLERCPVWAELGECEANASYMNQYCAFTCGTCVDENGEQDDPNCADKEERCSFWAEQGECDNNPNYMRTHCAKSCRTCPKIPKQPLPPGKDSKRALLLAKTKAFGDLQTADGDSAAETEARIESTIKYMQSDEVKNLPKKIRSGCLNRNPLCTFWQVSGDSLLAAVGLT